MDHHDKRAAARRELSHTVHIATGVSPPLECRMTDVSLIGARLSVHDSATVPQQFMIMINSNLNRWCDVMWRSGNAVGVQFAKPPKTISRKPKPAILVPVDS